jgi:hypothetical protein
VGDWWAGWQGSGLATEQSSVPAAARQRPLALAGPTPPPSPPPRPTRLRKDPLDPIDSGTKVAILFKRLTDPEFVKREEEAKKKKEDADKAAAAAAPKKAGAWGGLPGARR